MKRLILLAAIILGVPSAAHASVIPMAPGGSLTAAYNAASSGDVIELQAGSYGRWETPTGSKQVTVKGVAGSKLSSVDVNAANLTLDTVDIDGGGAQNATLYTDGNAANFTIRNSRVGNVTDEKGALFTDAPNVTVDNTVFHDVIVTKDDVHNECIYTMSPGITIRNSTFTNCATFDVFLTRGSWWSPPQPAYGNVTLAGNQFGPSRRPGGSVHTYTVYFADIGATWKSGVAGSGTVDHATLRGNAFALPAVAPESKATNSVESCNTGDIDLPGIVHESCAAPGPTPTPTPTPGPTPVPTPEPTPAPTPVPYEPACAPTCDEQIADLTKQRDTATDTLARIRQLWADLSALLGG